MSATPVAAGPIEALARQFFDARHRALQAGDDDAAADTHLDESWTSWESLARRRPESRRDAEALVAIARYWIVFYEGDTAGVIDEPWLRDVHELLGRVETYLASEDVSQRLKTRREGDLA